MEHLTRITQRRDTAIYELKGEHGDHLTRYIATTPESRRICNQPELVGVEYTNLLETALTSILEIFPPALVLRKIDPRSISVIHFLRGSLNFGLRRALNRAYGFNTHTSSFITSQRERDKYGRWFIGDNQYRKIILPHNATLFFADVVATGLTISNGLDIITNLAKNTGSPLRRIIFFTIGCHKLEKILKEFDKKMRGIFRKYEGSCLVYLEGKFHLADSKTAVRLKLQGTDLMRSPCPLAPEFELSQYDSLSYPLERCVIYDAGTRAYHIQDYIDNLIEYWEELRALGKEGWTLADALHERWPEDEYVVPFEEFRKMKSARWQGISRSFLKKLHDAHHARWTESFRETAATPKALIDLCDTRLSTLKKL